MSFEAWPVQRQAFDLVLAAQAFHWIAPEYGCAKAADALKPGGALAIVGHHDVSQDTAFWQATLPIYETYFPVTSVGERNISAQEVLCGSDVCDNLREVAMPGIKSITVLITSNYSTPSRIIAYYRSQT